MLGCITVNIHIQNFKIRLLCFVFFRQEETTPYSLLSVRIIKLKNAHQADYCKYLIFLLMLHHSQITLSAPACLDTAQMQNTKVILAKKLQLKAIYPTEYLFAISEVYFIIGNFFTLFI